MALLGAVVVLAPSVAAAQNSALLERFHPAESSSDGFSVRRALVEGHLAPSAQLVLDYANDPLVFEGTLGDAGTERTSVVAHQLTGHFIASLAMWDRVLFYGGLPVNLAMSGEDADATAFGQATADGFSLSDPFIGGRARIAGGNHDTVALAFAMTIGFPLAEATDADQTYAGNETMTGHPELTAEVRTDAFWLAVNTGVRLQGASEVSNVSLGSELTYGLGAGFPFAQNRFSAHAELVGSAVLTDFAGREATALEALAGIKYFHDSGLTAGIAAGPGLGRGYGTPDARVLGTFAWSPIDEEEVALIEEPELDSDGDSYLDSVDSCPFDPEDFDVFEDEDGCPEADNDGDGVVDLADSCPVDVGPRRNEGCPYGDRDDDTVLDPVDNCPDEFGSVENHGCAVEQVVAIADGRLEIMETVYFRTDSDVIQPRSYNLLDNVASVLRAHPEIDWVRVDGHTDARGSREHNMDLSQRRAESVVRYLIDAGVPASRLNARGFGPDSPIISDAYTREEHAQNRRVEFNIGNHGGIEQRRTGPTSDTIDR